ncbi:MAG TPA: 30S ribosomal protein S20 [Candidatus Faecicola pullistercoris]|nr:30S ribosomal protein S20 [Candidatus Faecicola pullistercoris]
MPNIKSQIKRVQVTAVENARNSAKRTKVKNAVKKFNAAIDAQDVALAEKLLPETVAVIDAAKSDGIYHKNTAARKVSTLYKALNALKAQA